MTTSNGVKQQKGQILIVIVLLAVVAIILFSQLPKFFGGESGKTEEKSAAPAGGEPRPEESGREIEKKPPLSSVEQEKPKSAAKESDSSSPVIFNLQPVGGLPYQTKKAYLSLETDEKAACRHSDVSGVYYEYMQGKFSTEDGFSHQVLITTLSEGESYVYYVRCIDEASNSNTEDSVISFWVRMPEDFTAPERANAYPTGDVLPSGTRSTVIGVSTDESASCRYDTNAGIDYDSMDYSLSADRYKKYHTATISNLADGQAYGFYIRCKDLRGNKNTKDVLIWFDISP